MPQYECEHIFSRKSELKELRDLKNSQKNPVLQHSKNTLCTLYLYKKIPENDQKTQIAAAIITAG